MSNNDDGTYLQPMIPNAPPDDPVEYQYIRDSDINSADKPIPLTDTKLQPPKQISSAHSKSPNLDLDPDPSTEQPDTAYYDDCINTSDNGAYLEVLPNFPPDHEEYEYVRNQENGGTSVDEKLYMDLDGSSRQPDSVYQEVTNPENLKQQDLYLALDLKSSITDSEYQALGPQDSEPTYDTAI